MQTHGDQAVSSLLIVSDNPELTDWFQSELERRSVSESLRVEYRYSSVNRDPVAMKELGATSLDTQDPQALAEVVSAFDLVISLHCKQIFPPELVTGVVCINVHPGFNPFNRGWFPQAFSIINMLPIGATIHVMDAEVDHGPIIDQERVDIDPSDTSLEVYRKVLELEKVLVARNLDGLLSLSFDRSDPDSVGNYNGIADYRKLCQLDLGDVATLGNHLNVLRALSHGQFKNAYFVEDGIKYFVRVAIESQTE